MKAIVVGDTGTKDAVIAGPFYDVSNPVLYVKVDEVPASVRVELARLAPDEILVFGGTARVSDYVVSILADIAPTRRIAGSSVFGTSIAASQDLYPVVVEPPIEPPPVDPTEPPVDQYTYVVDFGGNVVPSLNPSDDTLYMNGIMDTGNRVYMDGRRHVGLWNMEIMHAITGTQSGAIHVENSEDILVAHSYLHHNDGVGMQVRGSKDVHLLDSRVMYNAQLGIGGWGDNGKNDYVLGGSVKRCEVAFNNPDAEYSWGWEAGGSKFWSVNGLVVEECSFHDNHGPGIWLDHDNIDFEILRNVCEDNYANGIMHEIGYQALIAENQTRRNGWGHAAWLWGPGILIASSGGTTIRDNVVEENYNGIGITQQNRGAGLFGDYRAYDNVVENNRVTNGGSLNGVSCENATGLVQDNGDMTVFDRNTFRGNTYESGHRFAWMNQWVDEYAWRTYHPEDAV